LTTLPQAQDYQNVN